MTRDEILSMARKAELMSEYDETSPWISGHKITEYVERFAALVAEKEREACAKEAESWGNHAAAAEIRERGQKEYRGARLVLTKDGVIQDGWMGDK